MIDISPIRYAALRAAYQSYFGITRCEADILTCLFIANGSSASCATLASAGGVASHAATKVHLSRLRDIMVTEAIDYTKAGYRLTEVGMAEVREAMNAMRDELAA